MPKSDHQAGDLSRPVFFARQQLTKDDLNCLLDYLRARQRRHNRHVIGWGVTCGLAVSRVDGAPWQVRVGPGYALTPAGEEVEVPADAPPFDVCRAARDCLDIPGPCPEPFDLSETGHAEPGGETLVDFSAMPLGARMSNPLTVANATLTVFGFEGAPASATIIETLEDRSGLDLGTRTEVVLNAPTDRLSLTLLHTARAAEVAALDAEGATLDTQRMTVEGEPQTLTFSEPGVARLTITASQDETILISLATRDALRGEVYLALCPDETPACFKPAVPELCQAPGENIFPSRMCESYRLTVLCDLPPSHRRPSCEELEEMICGPAHVPCPPAPDGDDCVVVATLSISDNGIVGIDEFSHRRRLAPQAVLADLAACRCAPAVPPTPTPPPTRTPPPTVFTRFTLPTTFTRFTALTTFTRFSEFVTDFTRITQPTALTQITQPTRLTLFSEPATAFTSVPSAFTSVPSAFTSVPSAFTSVPSAFTSVPSAFTQFSTFTGILRTGQPPLATGLVVTPGGPTFDATRGREMSVGELGGIGRTRMMRLRRAGISNLTSFIEGDTRELARLLNLSEVRVAAMQDEARALTRRRPG